jgi:DNA repair exonuclease SbcCD ATPase subunit
MKFETLTFENFMSFRSEQVLPLADLGLVLVAGDNRLSASADSNGSGKTAVFEALCWGLFGQTLRGLKADDVACRFTRGQTKVQVDLKLDTGFHSIIRTRRPQTVSLVTPGGVVGAADTGDDPRAVQEKIDQLLGFGFRTFRNAAVFGQQTFERFSTASQADQLRMLDEIQNVDYKGAQDRAKAWRDKAAARLEQIQSGVTNAVRNIELAVEQLELLKSAQAKFVSEKIKRLEGLEGEAGTLKDRLVEAQKILNAILTRQVEVAKLRIRATEISTMKGKIDEITHTLDRLKIAAQSTRDRLTAVQETIKGLIAAGKCPKCRVKIAGAAQVEMQDAFAEDIPPLEEALAALERQRGALINTQEEQRIVYTAALSDFLGANGFENLASIDRLEQEVSSTVIRQQRRIVEDLERDVQGNKDRKAQENQRVWDNAPRDAAERTKATAEVAIKTLSSEQGKVTEAFSIACYWTDAFGDRGIRSLMFDSVAEFLNERVAAHLDVLTAGEASVVFAGTSILKGGGAKERLSVGASWGWGAGSYAAGSAGQDRRVDLAIFGAIQDLAERRSARPFPLKIWDEAGDSLDAKGKEIFGEWVRREARRRGSGFVITHDKEFSELLEPDHVWTVVLDKNGSHVKSS